MNSTRPMIDRELQKPGLHNMLRVIQSLGGPSYPGPNRAPDYPVPSRAPKRKANSNDRRWADEEAYDYGYPESRSGGVVRRLLL